MGRIVGLAVALAIGTWALSAHIARGAEVVEGGKPVQGLRLRLESEKDALTMTPVEDAKGPAGWEVEPAKLSVTFVNAGLVPIKLIGYDVGWGLVKFEVKGPDGEVVGAPTGLRHSVPDPKEKDFPKLTPSRSWAPKWEPVFPAKMGPVAFRITKPGDYRITAIYTTEIQHLGMSDFAEGSWINSVRSNTITIKCVLPAAAAAGPAALAEAEEVEGLKLTIAASKSKLLLKPRELDRAGPETPRYDVEPFRLKLTFANVSDKPIKLDAFALEFERLDLAIVGPREKSVVKVARRKAPELQEPTEKEFPVIAPGKTWSFDLGLTFPCDAGDSNFALQDAGEYRLRVTYEHAPEAAVDYAALVKGSWDGRVRSNEVAVKCAEAGGMAEPEKEPDLKIELKAEGKQIDLKPGPGGRPPFTATPVKVVVAFTNTTDKPMKLGLWEMDTRHLKFKVVGPDGDSVKVLTEALKAGPAAMKNDFPTLEPGAGFQFETPIEFPGSFGGTTWKFLKPGEYHITATYTMDPADVKRSDFAAGCWTGSTAGAELVLEAVVEPEQQEEK